MNALQTIGIKKALQFFWFSLYAGLLRICLFPQIRAVLMRLAGASIGSDTIIHNMTFSNLYHYGFSRLTIGNKCFLGDEVQIDCRGRVTLEDHVTLSNRTTVVSHINVGYPDHPLQRTYPTKEQSVIFKRGCYIGTGAIILPGVTIGRESAVASGAVVVQSVKDHTLVAGVPAVVKKQLKQSASQKS